MDARLAPGVRSMVRTETPFAPATDGLAADGVLNNDVNKVDQVRTNAWLAYAPNPWVSQMLANLRFDPFGIHRSDRLGLDEDDRGDLESVSLKDVASNFDGWSVVSDDASSGPKVDRSGFERLVATENSRRFVRW